MYGSSFCRPPTSDVSKLYIVFYQLFPSTNMSRDHMMRTHGPWHCGSCSQFFGKEKELKSHKSSNLCKKIQGVEEQRIPGNENDDRWRKVYALFRTKGLGTTLEEKQAASISRWFEILRLLMPDIKAPVEQQPLHPCKFIVHIPLTTD